MPSNYTGSPTATQSPGPAITPGAIPIGALPIDADARNSASTYQPWKECLDYIAWLMQSGSGGTIFGNGTDGNYTASVTGAYAAGTQGQHLFFQNLTINASIQLWARGYIIHVKDTLTIASGGRLMPENPTIMQGGSLASGSPGGTVWGSAGAFFGASGGYGAAGSGPGANSNSGGGAGGAGGAGTAGTAFQGAGTWTVATERLQQYLLGAGGWAGGIGAWAAITGGSGGGAGGGSIGYSGGGGGAGGPPLLVFARRLVIADALSIQSLGGNGGAGTTNGTNSGGGGGGGGGGFVGVVYGTKTGPALSGNVAAGAGGAVGGGGAAVGAAGATGVSIEFPLG